MSGTAGGAGTATATPADGPAKDAGRSEHVWRNLLTLVLEQNERRKEIGEALGLSFFRVKALRRIADRPSTMSELATRLACDRPYLTLVVDDLEKRGLVERNQHPTDRRCKIVTATPEGHRTAARADAMRNAPPAALDALPAEDLAALDRIVAALVALG